jgi:hypothetical protein
MTVSKPSLGIYPTVSMQVAAPVMSISETSLGHPNTATYVYDSNANMGDCNIQTGVLSSYNDTSDYLYYGNGYSGSYKTWIPFELAPDWGTISRGTKIVYAQLILTVKNVANESENVGIQIGCENLKVNWDSSGYTTYPTNYNDLNSRAMTNSVIIIPAPMGLWGESRNLVVYDVTDPVQEAINGSFWDGSGGLAIMIWNYNSNTGGYNYCRRSYSSDEGDPPLLEIGIN